MMQYNNSNKVKKKVLISAYAVSPYLGSEYGVGWNYITKLSAFYDISVLYGTSGLKMGDNSDMLKYLEANTMPNINFIYVKPNFFVKFFDFLNRNINSNFFPFCYKIWQYQVYTLAKKLDLRCNFDIIHQLNSIGFRYPGYLWKIKKPFIWGPVGGTSNLNKIFFSMLGLKNYLRHLIRNFSNIYFLRFSANLKNVTANASCVFCATTSDKSNFSKYLNRNCEVIRENSISLTNKNILKTGSILNIVWVGRIDELKALIILLNSLSFVGSTENWRLHIIGDGPSKIKCVELSDSLGISENITWYGFLPRKDVYGILAISDLYVITSLMDSNPTSFFESLEMGIPTIALNHFGMGDIIDSDIGFTIKIDSIDNIIHNISSTINLCINNPKIVDKMKLEIVKRQSSLHWDITIDKVRKIYDEIARDV